jgi:hypothetical protein
MEKFLNIPVFKLLASGTTTSDGTPSELIDETLGVDFVSLGVKIGDIIHNSTDNTYHTVTSVTVDTLGADNGGLGNAKDYFIHSDTISNSQLVSGSGVLLVEQASTSTVTITYDAAAAAADVVTLTHTPVASGSEAVRDLIEESIVKGYTSSWTDVSHDVSSLPNKVIGISLG